MQRPSHWSVRVARIAGIDIRIHVTFVLLVALFAVPIPNGPTVAENLLFLVVIAASIVAHELAHSIVARGRGATVEEIVLLPIGGLSKLRHLPETSRDEFAIAIVGPLTSIAIAVVGAALAVAIGTPVLPVALVEGSLLHRTIWFNLIVGGFNLLPAFPMDGGRVLRSLLERRMDLEQATRRAARLGRVLAGVLAAVGIFVDLWLVFIAAFVWFGATVEEAGTLLHLHIRGRRVSDAMLLEPLTLDLRTDVDDVFRVLRHTTQQWFPVTSGRDCVGILDVGRVPRVLHRPEPSPLGIPPTRTTIEPYVARVEPLDARMPLEGALERLQEIRADALPVVRGGDVVGVLRIEDVIRVANAARPAA